MVDTRVRIAERDDVPALVGLMIEFYREAGFQLSPTAASAAFVALLDDSRLGRVWMAVRDAVPAGYLVVTLGFSMEFGGIRGIVDDFFVRPSARGQGLGAMMLTTAQQACQQLGVRALLVETGQADHPARRLYGRAGFQESGRVLLTQAFAPAIHE